MARTLAETCGPATMVRQADTVRHTASLCCQRAVRAVAPGESRRNLYVHFRDQDRDVPYEATVSAVYKDDRGRRYDDEFSLSVELHAHETFALAQALDRAATSALVVCLAAGVCVVVLGVVRAIASRPQPRADAA